MFIWAAVAALLSGSLEQQALAGTLFEQPPDPRIFAGSSSQRDYYGKRPGRRMADDFSLNDKAVINEIVWWGLHAQPSSGLDDFVITFFTDADRLLPGTALLETRGQLTSKPHPSIPALTEYRMLLCRPFPAETNIRYWVSIFNASPNAAWRWNNSIVGNKFVVQSFVPADNDWQTVHGEDTDAGFRLGTVPESVKCPVPDSNRFTKIIYGIPILFLAALWIWGKVRPKPSKIEHRLKIDGR